MVGSAIEGDWDFVDIKGREVYFRLSICKKGYALVDDYSQKLDLTGNGRTRDRRFWNAAVSLAMCKHAGYPFQIEVDQPLRQRDFI